MPHRTRKDAADENGLYAASLLREDAIEIDDDLEYSTARPESFRKRRKSLQHYSRGAHRDGEVGSRMGW